MFKVWILNSSGSDIIIQIRTRDFGVPPVLSNQSRGKPERRVNRSSELGLCGRSLAARLPAMFCKK